MIIGTFLALNIKCKDDLGWFVERKTLLCGSNVQFRPHLVQFCKISIAQTDVFFKEIFAIFLKISAKSQNNKKSEISQNIWRSYSGYPSSMHRFMHAFTYCYKRAILGHL